MSDARMTISGILSTLHEQDAQAAKTVFLQKNAGMCHGIMQLNI
jgi:hypothetical protein